MIESRNIGRTGNDFQCRVRFINGLFALSFFWQQASAGLGAEDCSPNRKAGARPAFRDAMTERRSAVD
jgi:hypothetical protein